MLLCLERDMSFNAYVDLQIDHLQRQLKARNSMTGVTCKEQRSQSEYPGFQGASG